MNNFSQINNINSLNHLRVIIIDDNADFAESQAEFLENRDFQARIAPGKDEAILIAKDFIPDIALIDLRLKGESGIEVIPLLKNISPDIICIMLTGYGDMDTAIGALRQGASDYLHKPVDPIELETVLYRSYERIRLQKERINAIIAREKAEAANAAKSEFLSRMSHELRTPLNSILGFTQMMQLERKKVDETHLEYVNIIHKAGEHLLDLINDILDMSKIETGNFELDIKAVEMDKILKECQTLLEPAAEKNGINLNLTCSVCSGILLKADSKRLKQVFLNLLSNSIKYNKSNGSVEISCENKENNFIKINIHDTGKGIPEERQQELFIEFSRLGAENSAIEGTGIGLAICKKLIELMDGRIGVTSSEGEGSTFWIEIPLAS